MSKHYNILYFFGNGFDLSLNLKTRYEDFYEYLKDNMPDNEYIKLMLQEIGKDKELWSDMELALGKFTEKFKSIDDYLSFHRELIRNLSIYLNGVESKSYIKYNSMFVNSLKNPQNFLEPVDKVRFVENFPDYSSDSISIDIVSLNYTRTILKLLGYVTDKYDDFIQIKRDNINDYLFLHGNLDTAAHSLDMIVGVSDELQISNNQLNSEQEVKDYLIKVSSNEAMGNNRLQHLQEMIKRANLIVFYGLSFGDTDDYIWKMIGNNIRENNQTNIIQHRYVSEYCALSRRTYISKDYNKLSAKFNINSYEKDDFKPKFFFVYNEHLI